MKNFIVIALLIWVMAFSTFAQNYTDDFGKFKINEVTMTSYDRDKTAEAVVLYDLGNTFFYDNDDGYRIIFERSTKIKILSKAGLDYAQVEIPYYVENSDMEKVYDIEGYTYGFDGADQKISRLDPDNTFDEKLSDHWMVKKFALPDVKEGSVIEYRYKVISPYFFNLRDWEFQSRIPVAYSEYTTRMIPFYEYHYIFQGASKFDVYRNTVDNFKRRFGSVEFTDNIFTFGMKNIPAFRDEDYITSINDYIMKIDFQLAVIHYPNGSKVDIVTTWPLLIQSLLKQNEFGNYMKSAAKNAEEIIGSLALGSKTNREKAEIIYNYTKSNYNWSGTKDKYAGKTAKEFLKAKTGNSAEINLFLCSMLNAAGIQAFPVLVSTRDHGKISVDYPFQQFLNYVIVITRFDDQEVLLDATEPLSPFGMLPARCINDKGLVVNKDKEEWIRLEDKGESEVQDTVFVSLNPAGDSVLYSFHMQARGHKALEYRREYLNDPESMHEEFITANMEIKQALHVQHEISLDKPFNIDYSAMTSLETAGNKLLIAPFPGIIPAENPLKLAYRSYPVDMIYRNKNNFVALIDIPEGYRYVAQVKDVTVENGLVGIQYRVENAGGRVKITGFYEFRKAVYQNLEYYDLKGYFSKIVQTFNEKIVLEKI